MAAEDEKEHEQMCQRVVEELKSIAFADIGDFVQVKDNKLRFVMPEGETAEKRRAIASIKEGTRGVEVRQYDKNRALYMLSRIYGLYERRSGRTLEDLGARDALLMEDGEDGGWDDEG